LVRFEKRLNWNFEKTKKTKTGSMVFYGKNPKKPKPKISNAISSKYVLNHNTISTVALHLKKQPRYLQEINYLNRLSI
jgi:hypothetical protein